MTYTKHHLAAKLVQELRCCTPSEFRDWVKLAPQTYQTKSGLLRTLCGECDPRFQVEMAAEGRCIRPEPWLYEHETL